MLLTTLILAFFLVPTILVVAACMLSSELSGGENWEESLAYAKNPALQRKLRGESLPAR